MNGGFDFEVVISFVSGAFGGLVITFFIALGFNIFAESEEYLAEEAMLFALVDDKSTSTSFFLGTGGSSDSLKYYYITQDIKGKEIKSRGISNTYVNEVYKVTPTVEYYDERFKAGWIEMLAPHWDLTNNVVFNIPKNSIKYDYNIDLE